MREALTSMFLPRSWMHLPGNMWFLLLFGDNVDDSMSRMRFVMGLAWCSIPRFSRLFPFPSRFLAPFA
jgi:membrane associated rhomboid family serine protease